MGLGVTEASLPDSLSWMYWLARWEDVKSSMPGVKVSDFVWWSGTDQAAMKS